MKGTKNVFVKAGREVLWIVFSLFTVFYLQATEPPRTEVRAVWLTTIYGLDWPKRPAANTAAYQAQRDALCSVLDKLHEANFNTVFFQVRLRGDVIYRSVIEQTNNILTGKYGVMPDYDPLAFAIEECHKRGMECHAWFVTFPLGTEKLVKAQGKRSVVKLHPKLCKRHSGEWYLDPGVPETADYLASLVNELVSNYDIDGIHFDYIRYPDRPKDFPDKSLHQKHGKTMKIDDWRRQNINRIVTRLHDTVKQRKPWVQVSSSPLGKYNRIERRPNAGWTAYESVYQDPINWMKQGKQDMVVPMMYYLHDDFFPFVDNWVENCNDRMIVPGLGAYRMDEKEGNWQKTDLTDQIDYSRHFGTAGCAFFRCDHILDNSKGLYEELRDVYFKYPAQLPPLSWLDDTKPVAPEEVCVERIGNELKLSWEKPESDQDLSYTIYYSLTDSIDTQSAHCILSTGIRQTSLYLPIEEGEERGYTFSVTASSRYHIESEESRETFYYQSEFLK